ncbi:hypothetical protein LguiB_018747 [Lonicera macranthoides]
MADKSPEEQHPVKTFGWAARDTTGTLSPFKFSRRATGEKDVRMKVLYCGICHTDLHSVRNDWGFSTYPIVPGHEIGGEVTEVGSKVTKFKVGDKVGVGCYIGSCGSCEDCANDLENYCPKSILTYPGTYHDGTPNYGGYSNEMVADERFVVRFPDSMPLDGGCPLLCAGITVYSPMKYYGLVKPGNHIGVVGLGGLGHIAVKFAKAFGLKVTAISTSPNKKEEALKHLGADSFVVSKDADQMQDETGIYQAATSTLDGIIDTVSASHPVMPLIGLLKNHGKFIMLGAPSKPLEISMFPLLTGRKMVGASGAGGLKETQEMLDFAAKHNITADIEVISMDYVNTAMERLSKGDVKYRFVIDVVMAKSYEEEHPVKTFGWAARDTSGFLSPFKFSRRATGEKDVRFKVLYTGICHSDLHHLKNDWGRSKYPLVPGHEIVGVVTEVGSKVQNFKVGEKVGVGCMVGSCRSCDNCTQDLENYCPKKKLTYDDYYYDGTLTFGGYSDTMVADEHFVIHWPDNLPLDGGAPLLCAGITTYSPLKYFGLDKPGLCIGIVGLGGLGHVAVKFAKAFGAKVTVISTSAAKKEEAIKKLGADSFLVSRNPDEMQAATGTLDAILDTVSAVHPLLPLVNLIKAHGKLILVGAPDKPLELPVFPLLMGRKIVAGSNIGGLKETQEMIDFAAKHGITADVEVIPMDYVNTAIERLAKADVRYRFVIDVGNTLKVA